MTPKELKNTAKNEINTHWSLGGNPNAIEQQESRGQDGLVESEMLPTDVRGKDLLEKAGVKFGKPSSDDSLFCEAILPEGWQKVTTEHPRWSKLIDSDSNERASIFYKAAFYDRYAFMTAIKHKT